MKKLDDIAYQQRRQHETINEFESVTKNNPQAVTKSGLGHPRRSLDAQSNATSNSARHELKVVAHDPTELAVSIGAVSTEELNSVVSPLWIYAELFGALKANPGGGGELMDWVALDRHVRAEVELAVPSDEWLHELFREPDFSEAPAMDSIANIVDVSTADVTTAEAEEVATTATEAAQDASIKSGTRLRRKDNKQLKKRRAAESRFSARTLHADAVHEEEDEEDHIVQLMKVREAFVKRGFARTGLTSLT